MTAVAPYEVPKGAVIVGGKAHPCAGVVRPWGETGMEFRPGKGARRRMRKVDLGVWHFTGGEGDAAQVYRTLLERNQPAGLGIEFIIDREGVIFQCCDPALVDTFDAGHVNDRSFGVEIVSSGISPPISKKGADRGTYFGRVHGVRTEFMRFYPPQISAAVALANAMSDACGIPREVPMPMRVLTAAELAVFKGHIGHLHVSRAKVDPGTELFDAFMAAGFQEV